MADIRVRSRRRFSLRTIALVFSAAAFVPPAMAVDSGSPLPDLSGQWGRDMLFFEPPTSGPGPIVNAVRKADGSRDLQAPCCAIVVAGGWVGDYTNPILKPEAQDAVKKYRDLSDKGTVVADLHNGCWPEPPPFVMSLHFGMQILQQKDEVTLLYLLYNTVRHVRLNASHPRNLTPSWQGHSVGRYEGDTLCKSSSPWRTAASSRRPGRDESPIGASSATGRKRSAPRIPTFWERTPRFRRRAPRISDLNPARSSAG